MKHLCSKANNRATTINLLASLVLLKNGDRLFRPDHRLPSQTVEIPFSYPLTHECQVAATLYNRQLL